MESFYDIMHVYVLESVKMAAEESREASRISEVVAVIFYELGDGEGEVKLEHQYCLPVPVDICFYQC